MNYRQIDIELCRQLLDSAAYLEAKRRLHAGCTM